MRHPLIHSRHSTRLLHRRERCSAKAFWVIFTFWIISILLIAVITLVAMGCSDPDGKFTLYQPAEGSPSRESWQNDCKICYLDGTCEANVSITEARHPDWVDMFGARKRPLTRPSGK